MDYSKFVLIFVVVAICICVFLKIMDEVLSFLIGMRLKKAANFAISMKTPHEFAYNSILDFDSLKATVRNLNKINPDISSTKDYEQYSVAIILLYGKLKEEERLYALSDKVERIISPQLSKVMKGGGQISVSKELFVYVFMLACSIERASIGIEAVIYIIGNIFHDRIDGNTLDKVYISVLESDGFYESCRNLYLIASMEVMAKEGEYYLSIASCEFD